MFGQDLEDVLAEDGDDAVVREVQAEHVNDAEGVVLDREGGG